jgi:tetratricopeptide (TPR) repeat protein/glycosyltransferase involved in cell wall biosynthesis
MPKSELRYPFPPESISGIRQFDLAGVSAADQEKELAEFRTRLVEWERQLDSIQAGKPGVVSVEIPVFRGAWLIPCIESVLYQTSTNWSLSMLWDGGDDLSRRILELIRDFDHPRLRVHFRPNRGIARAQNALSRLTGGEYIMSIDDDDMFHPTAVEKMLAHAETRPWTSVVRAQRKFIDEVGALVDQEPWFPFESRHFQHGMVTDIHNHSQPTIMRRTAYDRTAGWEGFEEFHHAGADCDIFLKIEEHGAVELLDEVLYFYRLHGGRTSHQLGPAGAFEMWRRLADKTIQRRGLPIRRANDAPPFRYERIEGTSPTKDNVDVVIAGGPRREAGQTEKTVRSLRRCGVPNEAIHVVASDERIASARNQGFRSTTRPIVLYVDSGVEFLSDDSVDKLLAIMQQHDADIVGPQLVAEDGTVESSQTRFDSRRRPRTAGRGDVNRSQYRGVVAAPWLPASVLCVRREVMLAAGGFDDQYLHGTASDVDFSLKARLKDFKCIYAGSVAVVYEGFDPNTSCLETLHEKWKDFPLLLQSDVPAPQHAKNGDQPTDSNGWEDQLNQGDKLYEAGRWEESASAYRRAGELQPSVSWPHNGLGNALSKMERWEEAASAYRRAAELDPRYFSCCENMAHALSKLGRWQEAADAFQRSIEIDATAASAHSGLGDALAELGRWQEAANAHRRSIELDANRAWSHNNLANVLFKLEQWDDAAKAYERAVELDPDLASAHQSMGDALSMQSRWDEALTAYRRAIDRQPAYLWSHFNSGNALVRLRNWEEAAASYKQATDIDPEFPWAHYNLGDCLSELERWEGAVEAYGSAIRLKPDLLSAYEKRGHLLAKLDNLGEAAETFKRATELAPDDASVHFNLGDILYRLERWEGAIAAYRRAAELQPKRAWTYNCLGNALSRLNRWRGAAGAYQRALSIEPEFVEAQQSLGDSLLQLARWDEAISAYDRAIQLRPDSHWSHFNRANAFFHQQKWEEAGISYGRAVELNPHESSWHNCLGEALAKQERWETALPAFKHAIKLRGDVQVYYENLGIVFSRMGRWEEAAAAYGKALALGPDPGFIHFGLGLALATVGRIEAAAVAFRYAAEHRPDIETHHQYLGNALLVLERWEEAADAYRKTLALNESVAVAHHGLGDALARLERWDEAIQSYQSAIQFAPDYSWSHNNLANVLFRVGQQEAAAEAYKRATEIYPEAGCYQNLGNALFNLERWEEAAAAYTRAIELDPNLFWSHHNLALAFSHLERWEECITPFRRAAELDPKFSPRLYREAGDALLKLERWDEASEAYARAEELNPEWSRSDTGPLVARVEKWIHELGHAKKPAKGGKTRLLFVLDSDYGELTTVMYLLLGQSLRNESMLLLPSRLYVTNRDSLEGRTRPYTSQTDILKAIDREKPEIVFLCSAYLFTIHNLVPLKELPAFVRAIRNKGCQVVTADPFLGTLSKVTPSRVSIGIPDNASEQLQRIKVIQDQRLMEHFSKSFQALKDLVHLYPAYTGSRDKRKSPIIPEIKTTSFCNPELLLPADIQQAEKRRRKRHWFFMIASRDYETQVIFHGKEWFIDVLVGKLEQAQRAGRHIVFVGPYDCVQTLIGRLTVTDSVTLMSFCSFQRFTSLLLTAEYAFYWNSLSHSMLLRLLNKAPVFQFDKGHLVRNVKPLYKRIVDCYYQGWEPIYLDQEKELDPENLKRLAAEYQKAAERVSVLLQRAPSPVEMIQGLKGRHGQTENTKPAKQADAGKVAVEKVARSSARNPVAKTQTA